MTSLFFRFHGIHTSDSRDLLVNEYPAGPAKFFFIDIETRSHNANEMPNSSRPGRIPGVRLKNVFSWMTSFNRSVECTTGALTTTIEHKRSVLSVYRSVDQPGGLYERPLRQPSISTATMIFVLTSW